MSLRLPCFDALSLHGDLEQIDRDEHLLLFANGSAQILVATDLASRGLDIKDVEMVINYELPGDAEDYLHRAGRTGRAGKEGRAISLVCKEEKNRFKEIEKILKYTIQTEFYPGFETKEWLEKEAKKGTIKAKIEYEKANKKLIHQMGCNVIIQGVYVDQIDSSAL